MQVHREKQKLEFDLKGDETDYVGWLNGFYVREALMSTVGNMFNKGKQYQYPKERILLTTKNSDDEEEAKRKDEMLLQKNYMEMLEWTKYFNNRNKDNVQDSE